MLQKLKEDLQPSLPVIKKSFIAGLVCTFLVHMYPMVNQITNHDGVVNLLGRNDTIGTGRWLLTYATYVTTKWAEMPWVIGVWSALFLAVAVVITVDLLQLRTTAAIWACAGLMVSFPVVACTFAYKFTAAVYFFALLLAVAAAWLFVRNTLPSVLAGILLLGSSMAIYQAYISVAVGLLMVWAVLYLVQKPEEWKTTFRKGIVSLLAIAGSGAFYVIGLKIMLRVRNIELSDYRGVDQMGQYTLEEIPELLRVTWKQVYDFFTGAASSFEIGSVTIFLQGALFILGFVALVLLIVQNKIWKKPVALVLTVLLLGLLPFGMNCIQLLNKSEPPHMLMIYGYIALYLLAVALIEHWYESRKSRPRTVIRVAALALCAGIVYQFAMLSNLGYLRQQISMVTSEQFANRVVMRLEQEESFGEVPVMFVGGFTHQLYPVTNSRFSRVDELTGLSLDAAVYDEPQLRAYIEGYLQVKLPSPTKEQREQVMNSQEFADMPIWPAEGCIAEINDVLVVKFEENGKSE